MKIGAWRAVRFLLMRTKLRFCSYSDELLRCAVCAVDYVTGHAVYSLGCRMPGGSFGPPSCPCVAMRHSSGMAVNDTHTHTQIVFTGRPEAP